MSISPLIYKKTSLLKDTNGKRAICKPLLCVFIVYRCKGFDLKCILVAAFCFTTANYFRNFMKIPNEFLTFLVSNLRTCRSLNLSHLQRNRKCLGINLACQLTKMPHLHNVPRLSDHSHQSISNSLH